MRNAACAALVLAIALIGATLSPIEASAAGNSGFAVKLNFSASGYPSDQDIVSGPVTAHGDSPELFDVKNYMIYHFDRKFGIEAYGALCWQTTPNIELELGFGYRDLQLEITQFTEFSYFAETIQGRKFVPGTPDALDSRKDNEFSIMTIRPGAMFTTGRGGSMVPYLSAGLDIMIVQAKTTLDFIRPYVTEDPPGNYHIFAGTSGALERLTFDGSEVVMGIDVGSGVAFRISSMLSFTVGVSYLFQFGKAFREFGEYVEDNPADPAVKNTTYSFDGMNVQNVSFAVGMTARL